MKTLLYLTITIFIPLLGHSQTANPGTSVLRVDFQDQNQSVSRNNSPQKVQQQMEADVMFELLSKINLYHSNPRLMPILHKYAEKRRVTSFCIQILNEIEQHENEDFEILDIPGKGKPEVKNNLIISNPLS